MSIDGAIGDEEEPFNVRVSLHLPNMSAAVRGLIVERVFGIDEFQKYNCACYLLLNPNKRMVFGSRLQGNC